MGRRVEIASHQNYSATTLLDGTSGYTGPLNYLTIQIGNVNVLEGRPVGVRYNALADDDNFATTLLIDDVKFITHCGQAQEQSQENGEALLPWEWEIISVAE